MLRLGGARDFGGTRIISVGSVIFEAGTPITYHEPLFDLAVVCGHPRYKRTRIGAQNSVVNVKPLIVNVSSKAGVPSLLGRGMIAITAVLFVPIVF